MLKLYSFYLDCGRMGELEGLFIADPKIITESLGKEMRFGEALGKHSDICGTFNEDQIEVLSENQDKIGWLMGIARVINSYTTISGYSPLDYIVNEDGCDE